MVGVFLVFRAVQFSTLETIYTIGANEVHSFCNHLVSNWIPYRKTFVTGLLPIFGTLHGFWVDLVGWSRIENPSYTCLHAWVCPRLSFCSLRGFLWQQVMIYRRKKHELKMDVEIKTEIDMFVWKGAGQREICLLHVVHNLLSFGSLDSFLKWVNTLLCFDFEMELSVKNICLKIYLTF